MEVTLESGLIGCGPQLWVRFDPQKEAYGPIWKTYMHSVANVAAVIQHLARILLGVYAVANFVLSGPYAVGRQQSLFLGPSIVLLNLLVL